MSAPGQPGLSPRIRVWLIGIVLINVAVQLTIALSGIELPEPTERSFTVIFACMGVASLAFVLFVLKVDRSAVGLTLGNAKATFTRTGQQLLILGALAGLYTVGVVLAARMGRLKLPLAPSSMTDPRTIVDFCVLAIVVAPLYEELIFRGILASALDWPGKTWLTYVLSAAVFAVPHYIPGMIPVCFIGPFIVGLLLTWSFLRTRSILTSFLVHAAYNLGVVVKDFLLMHHPGLVRRLLGYE